jgi:hypothetical protein
VGADVVPSSDRADPGDPTMEFHPTHHTAIALAGTVPLPSPHPASGLVSLVAMRDGDDIEVFVKILQVVSDRRVITRFVRPDDVRAIRAHPGHHAAAGPESWPVLSIKKIRAELERRVGELRERAAKTGILDEAAWYAAGVVYVHESAPVLHRDEVGVTAAVSCEEVFFAASPAGCCHIASVPVPCGHGLDEASICCHISHQTPASHRRSGKERG